MQRRGGLPSSSNNSGAANPPIPTTIGGTRGGHFARRQKKKKINPILILIGAASLLLFVSIYYFPSEVAEVEREAEYVGHELASRARQAEHKVEELLLHKQSNGGSASARVPRQDPTERMLAQSSTWVDGEKALKKKLQELAELQQKGEYLGTPVLTRYLGEDIPAWISKDVNEAEWKEKVDAKYAEMRVEEEEWKKKMQKIIDERERDIGITTV